MKSISEILKNAKKAYLNGKYKCMCSSIVQSVPCSNLGDRIEYVFKNIQLFSKYVAKDKFGANSKEVYWWPLSDKYSRIKYFDWLIEQYKKKEK